MMIYVSASLIMVAMSVAMYVHYKTRSENMGAWFKWLNYLVILISTLLLLCVLTRGIMMMTCGGKHMQHNMHGKSMHMNECMSNEGCADMKGSENCKMHDAKGAKDACCEDDDANEHEMGSDSTHAGHAH